MDLNNMNNYKPAGVVLLKSIEFHVDNFISLFKDEWNMEIKDIEHKHIDNGMENLSFVIENMKFVCNMIPFSYPDNEAIRDSHFNFQWSNVVEEVSKHKAFIVIAVFSDNDLNQMNICVNYSKVCSTLMLLHNICAMYMVRQHLIINPKEYRKCINVIKAAESHGQIFLPTENWIRIGLYKTENGYSGYTEGLREFNKLELEIIDKDIELREIYSILNQLIFSIFTHNMNIKNGDIIHLDKKLEIILKKSNGVFIRGETLKIIF